MIVAGLGLYGGRWWLQERLPLLDDWPVLLLAAPALLLAAPALLLAGTALLVAARPGPAPDEDAMREPE
ncbi:hypothetical protein GCM10025874_17760 [Arenivirga flava]|uniref:Uncharacterized protein n=2 Tax=Arenivirga flava TaxID=1930060 RepID=A0AA37UGW2_9MICO|nr:hypothetical protein GCM10025874_17760 [Arenivirga flava]